MKSEEDNTTDARMPASGPAELAKADAGQLQKVTNGLTYDASDIDIPKINLVQKLSQIDGPVGSVVLDKKHVLLQPEEPVEVYIVRVRKAWRENLPFDDDKMPRMASNEVELAALEAEGVDMIEFADIAILIPQPEGNDNEAAYPFPIGGKQYAIGRINVAKDAYRQTYKRLVTFQAFNPNKDYKDKVWVFESQLISKGRYTWYAPSLSISSTEPAADALAFVHSF